MNKNVILVDIFDKSLKLCEKLSAHARPRLHRAFSVFLINGNKMLIQKRAKSKYHSGGLWGNACCSHPITDDIFSEANQRLNEELGISKELDLKELFSFTYFYQFNASLFEYEFDHVLIGEYDGEIKLNKEEAEKYKWISFEKLSQELTNNPQKFAPWFLVCSPRVLEILKK